jgi:DNA-binding XRE family transcriptional regulator
MRENGIKKARAHAGLTQQGMSDLLGIPKRNIEDWETGKHRPPAWAEELIIKELLKEKRRKEMKKIRVGYEAGLSRDGITSVDYMFAKIPMDDETIELYAELENDTWDCETESYADETATYDALKSEIIAQAEAQKINTDVLEFYYDDDEAYRNRNTK